MEKLNSLDDVLNFIFKVWYDENMSLETIDIPNKDINEPIPEILKKVLPYISSKCHSPWNSYSTIFGTQDSLMFERIDEVIFFIIENQGNWKVGLDLKSNSIVHTAGYLSDDDKQVNELTKVNYSLESCLMTFCLFETVMGSKTSFMDYVEGFDIKNRSTLLLENGNYVWDDDDFSFHYLTDHKILIMEGRSSMWFASNELSYEEIYSILEQKNKT